MLKFLADTLGYAEVLHGVDNLTDDQLLLACEHIKAELGKRNATTTKGLNAERIPIKNELKETGIKPRSKIECCLHCGSVSIKKHGTTTGGTQRYYCKDCGKTFAENYGLITHYTHLTEGQWFEVIRGIVFGSSLTEIAKNNGTSVSTAWSCKMKIYKMIMNTYDYDTDLDGIVEADGKYERLSFKGCKDRLFFIDTLGRLPRHHRSRQDKMEYLGDDYKRLFVEKPSVLKEMIYNRQNKLVGTDTIDKNHQQVCVLTAIDRANNIYIEPITCGTPTANIVDMKLTGVINRDALLVTDGHYSYRRYIYRTQIKHVLIDSKKHNCNGYNLATVNSLHSAMDRFLGGNEYLPATKYIDIYLKMFWWMQKQKELSQIELIERLFNITTGHVSNDTRARMKRITISSLVNRPLPIDTKGVFLNHV
jgi:transposase-like protein